MLCAFGANRGFPASKCRELLMEFSIVAATMTYSILPRCHEPYRAGNIYRFIMLPCHWFHPRYYTNLNNQYGRKQQKEFRQNTTG
jgi:hypothetical protein